MIVCYDILVDIFYWVKSSIDLYNISCVCKLWNQTCYDSMPWKTFVFLFVESKDRFIIKNEVWRKSHTLDFLCGSGRLDLCKWFCKVHNFTRKDIRRGPAFRFACIHGHLPIAKWLHKKFEFTTKDVCNCYNNALYLAHRNGHIDVVQWLYKTFQLTYNDLLQFCQYSTNCDFGFIL